MDECTICLQTIDDNHIKKVLTCGHIFHYRCFINLVYRNKNYFVECPLCRRVNEDITKPFTDPERNIRLLCARKVGKVRCICKTKKGTVCKRKARLLNYGMCYQHNPNVLKKELYPLMDKYTHFILCQRYTFLSRLYSFDIGKKLIIKHGNENTTVEDILIFWLKYISIRNTKYVLDYNDVYEYYDLEKPCSSWMNYCVKRHVIV